MNRLSKSFLVAALFLMGLFSFAQLYERPTEVVFEMTQLRYRPGVVFISPNYTTTIQFGALVQRSITSNDSLVEALVKDNIIYLRAKKPAGQTDLVVYAGNQTLMFKLAIESDTFLPRKYEVRYPINSDLYYGVPKRPTPSTPPIKPVNPTAPAQPAPPVKPHTKTPTPAPPTTSASNTGYDKSGEPLPASAPANDKPTSSDDKPTNNATTAVTPNASPKGIDFSAHATRTREGTTAVTYKISNKSTSPVVLDSAQLEVLDDQANAVKYQLIRLSTGKIVGRLAPGETEEAMIVVTAPNASSLTIKWPITYLGSGAHGLINVTVPVP